MVWRVETMDDFWRAIERRSDDKPGKRERSYLPQEDGRIPKLTIYMALKLVSERGYRASWASATSIAAEVRARAKRRHIGPARAAKITGLSPETTKKFLRGEHCLCLPPMLLLVADLDRQDPELEPLALELHPCRGAEGDAQRTGADRGSAAAGEGTVASSEERAEDPTRRPDATDPPQTPRVGRDQGVEAREPALDQADDGGDRADDGVNQAEPATSPPKSEHPAGPRSAPEHAQWAEAGGPQPGRRRRGAEPRKIDLRPLSASSSHSIPSAEMHVLVCRSSDGREWVFRGHSVDELLATLTRAVPRDVLRTAQVSIDRAPFDASVIVLEQRIDELNARIDANSRGHHGDDSHGGIWSVGGLGFDLLKTLKEILEDHKKERRHGKRTNGR